MSRLAAVALQRGPHWGPGPHGPMGPQGPHWGAGGMPWGGAAPGSAGWLWTVGVLLVLVAVIALGTYLAVRFARADRPAGEDGGDGPLTILENRFARGEIDEDEFERRRGQLTDGP